jgi:hypothetical protein
MQCIAGGGGSSGGGGGASRRDGGPARSGGGASRVASGHLRARQALRRIGDVELEQAVAHGDRRDFEDDGTAHYTYKNVCFVVSADTGVGITAWRLHPAQCVCKHNPEDLKRAQREGTWEEYDHDGEVATTILSVGLVKAAVNHGSTSVRNPLDDIAKYLCSLDLSSLQWRGIVNTELFQRAAIGCAAGALCAPIYCQRCAGVQRLRLPPLAEHTMFADESEALRWLGVLLDQEAERASGRASKNREDPLRSSSGPLRALSAIELFVPNTRETPLMVAAVEGRYRVCLELMKRGATTDMFAHSDALAVVYARARDSTFKGKRLELGVPVYEDILTLLSLGYQRSEIPLDERIAVSFLTSDLPGCLSAAEAPRQWVWDGRYHRILFTKEPRKDTCPHDAPGGWRALSSVVVRMTTDLPPGFLAGDFDPKKYDGRWMKLGKGGPSLVMPNSPYDDNAETVDAFVNTCYPGLCQAAAKSSSVAAATAQCLLCGQEQGKGAFSKSQWSKRNTPPPVGPKCNSCLAGGGEAATAAAVTAAAEEVVEPTFEPEPAPAPAAAAPTPVGRLAVGTAILISGLRSARELNGRVGVVRSWDQRKGRYEVTVPPPGGRTVKLKPENAVVAASEPGQFMPAGAGATLQHENASKLELEPQRSLEQFHDLATAHTSAAFVSILNMHGLFRKMGHLTDDDLAAALRFMQERAEQGGAAFQEGELWPLVKDREYMGHALQDGQADLSDVSLPLDPKTKLLHLLVGRRVSTALPNGAVSHVTALCLNAPRATINQDLATAVTNATSRPLPEMGNETGLMVQIGDHATTPELNVICRMATLSFVDELRAKLHCQAQDELVVVPLSGRVLFATKSSHPM